MNLTYRDGKHAVLLLKQTRHDRATDDRANGFLEVNFIPRDPLEVLAELAILLRRWWVLVVAGRANLRVSTAKASRVPMQPCVARVDDDVAPEEPLARHGKDFATISADMQSEPRGAALALCPAVKRNSYVPYFFLVLSMSA